MDRRRFVPTGDGLEQRALLSTTAAATTAAAQATGVKTTSSPSVITENYAQKEHRIENIPYFLDNVQPGRYLPLATVKEIQGTLLEMSGTVSKAPPTQALNNFNLVMRAAMPHESLSRSVAQQLNHAFSAVLASANVAPQYVSSLSASMNQLALSDSKGIDPSYLARNDYALILQTTLDIMRPIATPTRTTISPRQGKATNAYEGYTRSRTPLLVGTYGAGITPNNSTVVEIFSDNQVIALGAVQDTGKYEAPVATPLPDGTYRLVARAVDQYGHVSKPSKPFYLKVSGPPMTTNPAAQTITVTASAGPR